MGMILGGWSDDDGGISGGGTVGYVWNRWWVKSKSDPRWNAKDGIYGPPSDEEPWIMHEWIRECTLKYGEPPKDLVKTVKKGRMRKSDE